MEDILASIRRILSEDEAPAKPAEKPEDDVLPLDESMLVAEPPAPLTLPHKLVHAPDAAEETLEVEPADPQPADVSAAAPLPAAMPATLDRLVTPAAEAATALSVGTLLRTLESGRQAAPSLPVYRGGPTLEDMVREELRAMLREWLDANLPPLVERLVRAEIERLVGRAVG
jgi:cell pole-organizing protein PopZ